jgi:hypothetical protein
MDGTVIVCDAGHRNIDMIKVVESIHSNLVFAMQQSNNKINYLVFTRNRTNITVRVFHKMTVTNTVIQSASCHSVENKMIAKVMHITELKPVPSTKKKEKRNAYNIKYTG